MACEWSLDHLQYRPKAVLQLRGIIDYDVPEPRPQSPPPSARQKDKIGKRRAEVIHIDEDTFEPLHHSQAGPSVEVKAEMLATGPPSSTSGALIRKRKLEVIDIEDEEEARPEVQARLSTRVSWLEVSQRWKWQAADYSSNNSRPPMSF